MSQSASEAVSFKISPLLLVLAGGFCAESVATYLFLQDRLLAAFAVHTAFVGLSSLTAALSVKHKSSGPDRFCSLIIALAGPFGVGVCLIATGTYLFCRREAVSPTEWLQRFFDFQKDADFEHLHDRIAFGHEDFAAANGVEPFRDVLASGTVLEKQLMLAKIVRHFRPNHAYLLLQATRDENAAVRVQAATALARIERDFMKRRMLLEKKLAETPRHDSAWIELGILYDDYAYAGLADAEECSAVRNRAIEIFDIHKHRPDACLRLARLYLRNNKPHKTCDVLAPLLADNQLPAAISWYMEALFRLRRFDKLRAISKFYRKTVSENNEVISPTIENAIALWQKPSPPGELARAG